MVKLSPMIKNLTPGLAEAGKIKIGVKGQVRKTKDGKGEYQLPQKLDHFVVTSLVRDESGNFGRDDAIHQLIGDKPTRIPIMLLFDEIHRNFQSRYACYDGKKLWCSGDGEQANRAGCDEPVSCPCERSDTATPAKSRCKLNGVLSVIIRGTDKFGCVWKFRTTSYNTIQSITSSLYLIQQITGGPLAGLDLDMVLLPKAASDPDGNQQTIYVVGIEYVGGMEKLRDAGLKLATSAAAHRKLLTEAMVRAADDAMAAELSENADDVVEEHYPENDPNYVAPVPPMIDLDDGSTVDTETGEVTEFEPVDEPEPEPTTGQAPGTEPKPAGGKPAADKPATAKHDMTMLF